MPRDLTPAAEAAFQAEHVPSLILVEMDFPTGFLRLTNAGMNVAWGGHTWYGVGDLGALDPVQETATLEAPQLAFQLTGIRPEYVAVALGQHYKGRAVRIWEAPLDGAYRVVADPAIVWLGRMDTLDIELGPTATLTMTSISRLDDWSRAKVRRYNHEDQQIDYPGDLGLAFVEQMVEKELRWGY